MLMIAFIGDMEDAISRSSCEPSIRIRMLDDLEEEMCGRLIDCDYELRPSCEAISRVVYRDSYQCISSSLDS